MESTKSLHQTKQMELEQIPKKEINFDRFAPFTKTSLFSASGHLSLSLEALGKQMELRKKGLMP